MIVSTAYLLHLLLFSSLMWGKTEAATTVVVTFSGGAFQPSCINGAWTLIGYNVGVSISVNGGNPDIPMSETGLGTYNMAFFINNQAATVSVSNVYNVGTSATSANTWTFSILNDQPNIGANFAIGSCAAGAAVPTITAAFSTTTKISGTQPVVFNNVLPTVVNSLPVGNRCTGNCGKTKATKAPTAAPGTSVVVKFAGGAFQPTCTGGSWALIAYNVQVSISVNGGNPDIPMSETGLGTYSMAFFINNKAATVSVANVYNVGTSSTAANKWTFSILNDQPNIGANFFIGSCTAGSAVPTITAAFVTTTRISGTQPVVFNNVLPTVVNGLPTANQFTGTVAAAADPVMKTSSSSTSVPYAAIAAGCILAVGVAGVAGLVVYRRHKQQSRTDETYLEMS